MRSSPLRILHVVTSLEPGGMENGVVNLARHLEPEEFSVHICCLERAGAFQERLPAEAEVSVLGKSAGFSCKTVVDLARLIGRTKPHLIHTHNLGPLIYSGFASAWGAWRPILHGEHAQLNNEELTPKRLRQRAVFFHACQRVHTVSHALRDHLIQLGLPGHKIEVIINGVDAKRFSPGPCEAARRRLGLPADAVVVGVVGRFGPFKRHALLIESFTRLARERSDIHLLVVGGGGSEQDRVTQQALASGAADRIRMVGFQRETAPYYQAMDLLVVPSINEGLSNALLESMASGVPALCHEACGNREVVSHGEDGFVFDLAQPDDLSRCLQETLADPARLREMGRQARAKVLARFSLEGMVRNYERMYRELTMPAG